MSSFERKRITGNDRTSEPSGKSSKGFNLTRHSGMLADEQHQRLQPDTAAYKPERRARGRQMPVDSTVDFEAACERINSVEAEALDYKKTGWNMNNAREHVFGKLSFSEQQDYQSQVNLICSTINKMNQIPEGQNESELDRLIDQTAKVRNKCGWELAKMVPEQNRGPHMETGVDLAMRLQQKAKGHKPTLDLYQQWNYMVGIEKNLSELKGTYTPKDLAITYARIELLMSKAEGGLELKALKTAWKALRDPRECSQDTASTRQADVPSSDKGKGRAEPGPSQDVRDITPGRETKKAIEDLADYARKRTSDTNKHSESYKKIGKACIKIKLYFNMFDIYHEKQMRAIYGKLVKSEQDVVAVARDLKDILNNDLKDIEKMQTYRERLNKWFEEANI